MHQTITYSLIFILTLTCWYCQVLQKEPVKPDPLLAEVYSKKLYLSDLEGMFPPVSTKEDSGQIISNFTTRWTQEQVFLSEAEKHIPADLSIEQLLKKYKESLIGLNFQQKLINQNLDSSVSEEEIRDFYEKNKDQYLLETSIIRCYFVKIPGNIKEMKRAREWWDDLTKYNKKRLASLAEKYNGTYHLEDSIWHNVSEIETLFPKGRISARNWTNNERLSISDNEYQYFFKVLELVSKQENAPISYVADKARLIILNKRKNKLIEDFKTKLYETELRKNNVKIYQP
ncbi:MAG: hypothetical protein SH818_18280 [Saprospiraceae bacterium]|nr:hypothetical protein [Saprospiraceae bacterium]